MPPQPQRCMSVPGGQDGEVGKAQKAAAASEKAGGQPTIFSKIIDRTIPATILYEDDKVAGTVGCVSSLGQGGRTHRCGAYSALPGSASSSVMWPPKPLCTSL